MASPPGSGCGRSCWPAPRGWRRLEIAPLERAQVDELLVEDGDLPAFGGATVFDAWRSVGAVVLRAARIEEGRVTPLLVTAATIEIRGSDGRLEALLGADRAVAAAGELEHLACACRGISADAVYRAIGHGWSTADQLKRATRVAFGECQGRRCVPWLAARLELEPGDPRARRSCPSRRRCLPPTRATPHPTQAEHRPGTAAAARRSRRTRGSRTACG